MIGRNITRTAAMFIVVAMLVVACGPTAPSPTPAPTPTPTPVPTVTVTPLPTTAPSPTLDAAGFPVRPPLPSDWIDRSDTAKTYVLAVPSDFLSVEPKNAYHSNPDLVTKYGIVGDYQDPRIPDRAYCTPYIVVEDLPMAKGISIKSSAELVAWATNDNTTDPIPGSVVQITTVLNIHQGYAVAIIVVEPPNENVPVNGYHVQMYFAAPDGIWFIGATACGDAAWSNLATAFSVLPNYFEAPPDK